VTTSTNLQHTHQRSTSNRTLLQLNLPLQNIPIKSLAMTTKTQDISLAARKLAKIAEQLSTLANQLAASTNPKPKPSSAVRLLNPNHDRHSPGYMAQYMRKWRERRRLKS
jgi:hypothetical protein